MAMAVYLSPVARDLGPIGNAVTVFLFAMALGNFPTGWSLQRFRAGIVIGTGVALTALGYVAAAGAQDRLMLALALGVAGAGVSAATLVPGVAILTRHYPERRGLALAVFLGSAIVAGALLPPLVSWLIDGGGWRKAFLWSGIAIATLCLPLLYLIPDAPAAIRGARTPSGRIIAAARRNPDFRSLLLAMTFLQLAINGILFSAIETLMIGGLSQPAALAAYSIANLLGLPALLLGGLLTDRVGPRTVLIGASLLLGVGTVTLLGTQPFGMTAVVAFTLIWGIASALPSQSGSMLLADAVEPDDFAGLLGLNISAISLIGALAPAWTQWLREWSDNPALPIWVYAALAWLAIPFVVRVRVRRSEI